MVNITIDNKKIEVPEGTTILRAAEIAGIHIPTLCNHPKLAPYGGCRLCLVEVDGFRTLQPSCTLPVNNNMVVHTDTQKVREARTFVLSMIFSERNHFCPYCQVSGGDCELQNAAYAEGMTHWPLQPNFKPFPVDASHPYFILEHNRCILCRRCVRACGELIGNFTLGFEERGTHSFLVADLGAPLGNSSCISCGSCVQICPTGALIDRWSAYRGHEAEVTHTKTICVGCSIGCGIDVISRDNHLLRVDGDWDAPINGGVLCKVGRFYPMVEDRQRILTPLIRKDGTLKAATWDEAISTVAKKLKPMIGKGKDNVAAMVSTRLPVESLYAFKQIFTDGFQSETVTSTEEGQYTSSSTTLAEEAGQPFEGKLDTLEKADCVTVIGVDLVEEHEVVGFFVKRILPRGTKLVIIDPNPNKLDDFGQVALKPMKGSAIDVINGLSAAAVKLGLAKRDNALESDKILQSASEKTGIATDDFLTAAHSMASAKTPVIIFGKGISSKEPPQTLKALLDLARMIGVVNDQRSGLINVKGQANSLAAAQYHLDKPLHINGNQAAYVALGDEEPSQRLIQSLEKVPFKVVQASYSSKLTAIADVVLPVTMWAEQDGTYLSLSGLLLEAKKSVNAPDPIWSNMTVLETLARQLNFTLKSDWKEQLSTRTSPVALTLG